MLQALPLSFLVDVRAVRQLLVLVWFRSMFNQIKKSGAKNTDGVQAVSFLLLWRYIERDQALKTIEVVRDSDGWGWTDLFETRKSFLLITFFVISGRKRVGRSSGGGDSDLLCVFFQKCLIAKLLAGNVTRSGQSRFVRGRIRIDGIRKSGIDLLRRHFLLDFFKQVLILILEVICILLCFTMLDG